jgi:hypothetical protein
LVSTGPAPGLLFITGIGIEEHHLEPDTWFHLCVELELEFSHRKQRSSQYWRESQVSRNKSFYSKNLMIYMSGSDDAPFDGTLMHPMNSIRALSSNEVVRLQSSLRAAISRSAVLAQHTSSTDKIHFHMGCPGTYSSEFWIESSAPQIYALIFQTKGKIM